jgi:2-methylisocitrate lyase-like PEP mutase family enzyme
MRAVRRMLAADRLATYYQRRLGSVNAASAGASDGMAKHDDHAQYGARLRRDVATRLVPFIGIYDVFSASIAARRHDALFLSGFGFAASHYGLPDIGFIAWTDVLGFVQRLRAVLPEPHLLVDIDDGYGDTEIACHVVAQLESLGASGVVLEDQQRPRRCGHLEGKQILPLEEFLPKLERVLAARDELFVVARTDASDADDISRRVRSFAAAGADAILVDAIRDLDFVEAIGREVKRPVAFNQIAGGKSPPATVRELRERGVSMVIYSTPCLFPAQAAIEDALARLESDDGKLPADGRIGIRDCNAVLERNLAAKRR